MIVSVCIGLVVAIATAVASLQLHTIEIGHAENDLYVLQAERFLGGETYLDWYHPALYPQVVGMTKLVTGDAFLAARVVSALANGLLAATTFAFAAHFAGRAAAWAATLALVLHPGVLIQGMQASSDTLGVALCMATCAAAARAAKTLRYRDAALAGLCFGLASATRAGNFPFACMLAMPLLVRGQELGLARRAATAAAIAGGTALGYLPHGLAAWAQLGSPFANRNWRNTMLKAFDFDGRALHQPEYQSMTAFLGDHLDKVVATGFRDLGAQLGGGFGAELAPMTPPGVGAAIGAAVLAGLLLQAVREPRRGAPLLATFVGFLAMLCITFVAHERLLLPLFPLAYVALAAPLSQRPRWLAIPFALALGTATWAAATDMLPRLRHFRALHPHAEVAQAKALDADPTVERFCSTFSSMYRHVRKPVMGVWWPGRAEVQTTAAVFAHLDRVRRDFGVRHVLVGRLTEGNAWLLLHGAVPPPGVVMAADEEDFVLLRYDGAGPPAGGASAPVGPPPGGAAAGPASPIGNASVEPVPWLDGPVTLRLALAPGAKRDDLREACFVAKSPGGTALAVPLVPAASGGFFAVLPLHSPEIRPRLERGAWELTPCVLRADGTWITGTPIRFDVP